MRRRLIVVRHAKSAWDTEAPNDHERPLNKRGRRDAPRVGRAIAKEGWAPDHVLSSDAMRTRETWRRMKRSFDKKKVEVAFTSELYHAGLEAIAELVKGVGDKAKTVMVIGHNPGLEEALSELVGSEVTLTTCNAALLSVEAKTWAEAFTRKKWKLELVVRPKDL